MRLSYSKRSWITVNLPLSRKQLDDSRSPSFEIPLDSLSFIAILLLSGSRNHAARLPTFLLLLFLQAPAQHANLLTQPVENLLIATSLLFHLLYSLSQGLLIG